MSLRSVGRLLALAAVALPGCGPTEPPITFRDDAPANKQVEDGQLPLTFTRHDGDVLLLVSYKGKKPVVLVVVRGLPFPPNPTFCPYCLAQTSGLMANYPAFEERGAEVVLVFPGPSSRVPEFLAEAAQQTRGEKPRFPVVLDPDMEMCDRLGIRGQQAKPSTFILDKSGKVVYAYVGQTTSDRPSVKALLAQLDKLKGGS